MNIFKKQNYSNPQLGRILPWVALYALLLAGTATFATAMYHKYEEHHLPSGNIELTVDKTKYQLGESIGFTVTNHFPVPVYVTNQCPSEPLNVYRWYDGTWIQIHANAKTDGECYSEERNVAVPSEATRSYNFDDWPELFSIPGVYRIAASIDHYSDIPFQDFVVMEPAQIVEVRDTAAVPVNKPNPKPAAETTPIIVTPTKTVETNTKIDDEHEDEHEDHEEEHEDEEDD